MRSLLITQLIFMLITVNCFLISSSFSTSIELSGPWKIVPDSEKYNSWTTYSLISSSMAEMKFLQGGSFRFAWKIDKLASDITPNKLFVNNELLESTTNFQEYNGIKSFEKDETIKWVFSVADPSGGQVWIAFPNEYLPEPENMSPILNSLIPEKLSPQDAGTIIEWTANAIDEDEDNLLYRFLINGSDKTGWISENSWFWNTNNYLGIYEIEVQIRDGLHSEIDDSMSEFFIISSKRTLPPRLISLTPDKLAPQEAGCIVNWTASVANEGNLSLLYRFCLNGSNRTKWMKENSWTWNTTEDIGICEIEAQIKDERDTFPRRYEDNISTSFLIQKHRPIISNLVIKSDKTSPQAEGSIITFNALSTGLNLNNSLYRFVLRGIPATGWSTSPIWKWRTNNCDIGTNKIEVQVKDISYAHENYYNYSADLIYDIGLLVSDSEDLQESINSAQLKNISTIFIEGSRELSETLMINSPSIKLIGVSDDAKLWSSNNNIECAIYVKGDNCRIMNISIDGFSESIKLQADNCTIENVSISSRETAINAQESDGASFINNVFHGVSDHEQRILLFINNSSFLKIINNTLDNSCDLILLKGITFSSIDRNTIKYKKIGIEMIECTHAIISNNSILYDQNYQIDSYPFKIYNNCNFINITNNTIEGIACDDNSNNTDKWEMNCWINAPCSVQTGLQIQPCNLAENGSSDINSKCCNGE